MGTFDEKTAQHSFYVGRTLPDGYRIVSPLGEGGMGTVYKAVHPELGRTVAVKILENQPPERLVREAEERFRREARLLARLDHPSIVKVVSLGRIDGKTPYFVMDLARGKPLLDYIHDEERLPVTVIVQLGFKVLGALGAAHELTDEEGRPLNLVHRDIKPENIMLDFDANGEPFVKLLDFGVAQLGGGSLTRENVVVGTPAYMAPEQMKGEPLDGRTDLYAFGCVLFALLAGRQPFVCSDPDDINGLIGQHLTRPPPSFDTLGVRGVSIAVERVIRKAMAKEPSKRFMTAKEFAHALAKAGGCDFLLAGDPGRTRPLGTLTETVHDHVVASPAQKAAREAQTAEIAVSSTLRGKVSRPPRRWVWVLGSAMLTLVVSVALLRPSPPADRRSMARPDAGLPAAPAPVQPAASVPSMAVVGDAATSDVAVDAAQGLPSTDASSVPPPPSSHRSREAHPHPSLCSAGGRCRARQHTTYNIRLRCVAQCEDGCWTCP